MSASPGLGERHDADQNFSAMLTLVSDEMAKLDELRELLEFARLECQSRDDSLSTEREEIELLRAELDAERRAIANERREIEEERQDLDSRRNRLGEQVQRHRQRKIEWRDQRDCEADLEGSARKELEETKALLLETSGMLETTRDRVRELEARHREELEQLSNEFDEQFEEAEAYKARAQDLRKELAACLERIESLEDECEQLRDQPANSTAAVEPDQELLDELNLLKSELAQTRTQRDELAQENEDLAAELAEARVQTKVAAPGGMRSMESMSWEERKAAILAQLSQEDAVGQGISPAERVSLREQVEQADLEIQKRNQEIAELRELLDHQATTLAHGFGGDEGVMLGAAGIASMIDADELIQEERQKLSEIKKEWEEKLRQAEVELSLERAKLARGRRELEQRESEVEELRRNLEAKEAAAAPAPGEPPQQPRRRWLQQLGLGGDES